jgi:hypothetical protein
MRSQFLVETRPARFSELLEKFVKDLATIPAGSTP